MPSIRFVFCLAAFVSCLCNVCLCCGSQRQQTCRFNFKSAAAVLLPHGSSYSNVSGIVSMTQTHLGLRVNGSVTGLVGDTSHGFHIHEFGDLSTGCSGAGGHFNPDKTQHGAPSDSDRHAGDFGNILADSAGVARFNFVDKVATLTGENSVVGRSFVVHAGIDDLGRGENAASKANGNAGPRMICGVIGVA